MDHQAEELKSRHSSDFHQTHLQSFEPSSYEIYTLASGLGFQPKTLLPETPSFWQDNSRSLSLSLSSDDPSTIGLQTLDLRQTLDQQSDSGDMFGGKSGLHQQNHASVQERQFEALRSSKYLAPAQEILNELCCLGNMQKQNNNRRSFNMDGCSMQQQPLFAVDLMELHKRKKTLVVMLDELEKRHKHYVDKMEALVYSFEAAAGEGAARPYTSMASKAMSRHFRALRDVIVNEMKAVRGAMGEMDSVEGSHGGSKVETPRLRALDQALRRNKALQEMSTMDIRPWRPQRGLPEGPVSVLRAWLFEHFLHPYPSDVDKHILARQTGLSRSQVSNWFINARVRLWKPMVEEIYMEEIKEGQLHSDMAAVAGGRPSTTTQIPNLDPEALLLEDKNPSLDQRRSPSSMDTLDFSSYDDSLHRGFDVGYGRGGRVSLTLGLQQDGMASSSVLYSTRGEMVEHQSAVEYSPFEGDDDQIQGHQNILGADDQLLHDFP